MTVAGAGAATVGRALAGARAALAAAGVAGPDLDARLLLARVLQASHAQLFIRAHEPLPAAAAREFGALVARRTRRVPLAYLVGEREFWSLRIAVDRRVLIPRPETETLVEAALAAIRPGDRVAEIGTGSGAVVIALARGVPGCAWLATDVSPRALEVARANAAVHGVSDVIRFLEGDLCAPLAAAGPALDVIVSNPPYVPRGDLPRLEPEVRNHEPRLALDGGADGLAVLARLARGAAASLRPGGRLLAEIGAGQSVAVRGVLGAQGAWTGVAFRRDLAGIERVVEATRAG